MQGAQVQKPVDKRKETMKIPFGDIVLKNYKGEAIPAPGGKDMTLLDAVEQAFTAPSANARNVSGAEKFKEGALLERVWRNARDGEPTDLDEVDFKLIRSKIGEVFTSLVVLPAWRMLDSYQASDNTKDKVPATPPSKKK